MQNEKNVVCESCGAIAASIALGSGMSVVCLLCVVAQTVDRLLATVDLSW